jgi:DNA-binding response OmpR family regulator
MQHTLLMIDDDRELTAVLAEQLHDFNMSLQTAERAELGLQQLSEQSFDALILDVMLPDENGLTLLTRIRAAGHCLPILMLSARGDTIDRIVGIEQGADDYLAKPFHPRELVARLQALIRRSQSNMMPETAAVALSVGALTIDTARRQVLWHQQQVILSSTEFSLLWLLAQHHGEVVSKELISERVLKRPLARYERSIDVHISSIRAKLGCLADGRSCIQTIFRQGYQLVGS